MGVGAVSKEEMKGVESEEHRETVLEERSGVEGETGLSKGKQQVGCVDDEEYLDAQQDERDTSSTCTFAEATASGGGGVTVMQRNVKPYATTPDGRPDWRELPLGPLQRSFELLWDIGIAEVSQASRVCRSWRPVALEILLRDTATSRPLPGHQQDGGIPLARDPRQGARPASQPPQSLPMSSDFTTMAAITRDDVADSADGEALSRPQRGLNLHDVDDPASCLLWEEAGQVGRLAQGPAPRLEEARRAPLPRHEADEHDDSDGGGSHVEAVSRGPLDSDTHAQSEETSEMGPALSHPASGAGAVVCRWSEHQAHTSADDASSGK